MKTCLKFCVCFLLSLGVTPGLQAAIGWTHGFNPPVANTEDMPFNGAGPNGQSWSPTLYRIFGTSETYLETDTRTVSSIGDISGEYKLSDAGRNSWTTLACIASREGRFLDGLLVQLCASRCICL
jgi:hypothetical protein